MWVPPAPAIIIPAPQELIKKAMMPGIIVPAGLFGAVSTPAVDPVTMLGQPGVTSSSITINIGTADPHCLIIAAVHHIRSSSTGRTLNSVTIDGTAGTIHAKVDNNASSGACIGIASRTVTSGGTITISWSLNGLVAVEKCTVWKVITANTTPVTGGTGTANGNDPTVTLNLGAGGFCIVAGSGQGGTNLGASWTWTGATKDAAAESSTTQAAWSAAHSYNNSATTGATVSVAVQTTNEVLAAVAFPAP
jgi:hypothetical protein